MRNVIIKTVLIVVTLLAVLQTIAKSENKEKMDTKKIEQFIDRHEIEQLMYRHARSLDRMDAELMKSTYWPEAIEELEDNITGTFQWEDKAWDFVPLAMKGFENFKVTQHRVSNILTELDGDKANTETYIMAYHVYTDENGVDQEYILGARSLYKLEKRNGEWKIMNRSTILDWNINQPATANWSDKFTDKFRPHRGDMKDDSYNYIKGKK